MSRLGADVAELDALAAELQGYATSVDGVRGGIDAALARTAWHGPDADAFRGRWRTIAIRDLDGFRTDLVAAANELRRQAAEQRVASGVAGMATGAIALAGMAGRLGHVSAASAAAGAASSRWGPSTDDVYGLLKPVTGAAGAFLTYASQWTLNELAAVTNPSHQLIVDHKVNAGSLGNAGMILGVSMAFLAGARQRFARDANLGLSANEQRARAGASGTFRAAGYYGAAKGSKALATKGIGYAAKAGALKGAKFGAIGGPKGAAVGVVVGTVIGTVGYGMAMDSGFGQAIDDGVAAVTSGAVEVGRRAVDLGSRTVDAVGDKVEAAGKTAQAVVDDVGGRVDDAVGTVTGWFGR